MIVLKVGIFFCIVRNAWVLDICDGWDGAGIALSYFLGGWEVGAWYPVYGTIETGIIRRGLCIIVEDSLLWKVDEKEQGKGLLCPLE